MAYSPWLIKPSGPCCTSGPNGQKPTVEGSRVANTSRRCARGFLALLVTLLADDLPLLAMALLLMVGLVIAAYGWPLSLANQLVLHHGCLPCDNSAMRQRVPPPWARAEKSSALTSTLPSTPTGIRLGTLGSSKTTTMSRASSWETLQLRKRRH